MKYLLAITCSIFPNAIGFAADIPQDLYENFKNELSNFTSIRHELHQSPETKYEEFSTSAYIKEKLESYGYHVQTGIGGTGLVTLLDSGNPGKTVALRADMDGLPIHETSQVLYHSKNHGKMHACGHDGHMATLLMAAKILKEGSYLKAGKIKFIFQPAEEGGAGALKMIQDGVLENPIVDAIFGYHNWPLEYGVIGTRPGCLMAGTDRFDVEILGKGGHAAMPEKTVNPIYTASDIIQSSQLLISQKNPTQPAVLNITSIHSGTTYNVVANTTHLQGTLRTTSTENREKLVQSFIHLCQKSAEARDTLANVTFLPDNYPPTINTRPETDLVLHTAQEILTEDQVQLLENPVMPGEDFSFYLQKVPGCFFFVGYGLDKPGLHASDYDFTDEVMTRAGYVMAKTALNYLEKF